LRNSTFLLWAELLIEIRNMKKIKSAGKCNLCGGVFGDRGMTRHLTNCLEKQEASQTGTKTSPTPLRTFHLAVKGHGAPQYWLHLQVRADATLAELDSFLRHIWLECCGHMSGFRIKDRDYEGTPMGELEDDQMDRPLDEVVEPGLVIEYEYDFGSTTKLAIKVAGEQVTRRKINPVELLARNDPPARACSACGQPATLVCTECYDSGRWLCDACSEKHGCDPEMRLPVVNSPRVGVCGYSG